MDRRRSAGAFKALLLLFAAAGLALSFYPEASPLTLLVFFTIQSNLMMTVVFGYELSAGRRRRTEAQWNTRAEIKGAVTLYVTITGMVYHFVLMETVSPFTVMTDAQGVLVAEVGAFFLHYVTPAMAVLDWLVFDGKGRYKWRYAGVWLLYPVAYLAFVLIRGAVVTEYPYPFLNVASLSLRGTVMNIAALAGAFFLLGLAFVAVDRSLRVLSKQVRPARR